MKIRELRKQIKKNQNAKPTIEDIRSLDRRVWAIENPSLHEVNDKIGDYTVIRKAVTTDMHTLTNMWIYTLKHKDGYITTLK